MNYNFIRSSSSQLGSAHKIKKPKNYPTDFLNASDAVSKIIERKESSRRQRKHRDSSTGKSAQQRMNRYTVFDVI